MKNYLWKLWNALKPASSKRSEGLFTMFTEMLVQVQPPAKPNNGSALPASQLDAKDSEAMSCFGGEMWAIDSKPFYILFYIQFKVCTCDELWGYINVFFAARKHGTHIACSRLRLSAWQTVLKSTGQAVLRQDCRLKSIEMAGCLNMYCIYNIDISTSTICSTIVSTTTPGHCNIWAWLCVGECLTFLVRPPWYGPHTDM